jgi:hypothetical protein
MPRVIFSFFNGHSGQTLFDDYHIALYNLVFTSIPLILKATFDQDINYIFKKKQTQDNISQSSSQMISKRK